MRRSVESHLADVLSGVDALPSLEIGLLEARGCRVAEDVFAPLALPAFASALCEGYAVRIRDIATAQPDSPVALRVVDEVRAGHRPRLAVVPGAAVRVHLGSALPEGAQAVVPAEHVHLLDGDVLITRPVREGDHVRPREMEHAQGALLLPRGEPVDARRMALLAASGIGRALVYPRPRVVIVTVGDELVEPGTEPLPGSVSDSNGVMLSALVQQLGAVAYRVGPLPDDAQALERVLTDQLIRADLVVVVGGVSASSYETVSAVTDRIGTMHIHRVAMSPGLAQGLGHLGDDRIPLLTLPGHPAAAFVSFELFVRPVILRMAGSVEPAHRMVRAELLSGLRSPGDRRLYVPSVRVPGADGVLRVSPLHSEHVTADLARADCLLVVPDAVAQLMPGDFVDVLLLEVHA